MTEKQSIVIVATGEKMIDNGPIIFSGFQPILHDFIDIHAYFYHTAEIEVKRLNFVLCNLISRRSRRG